MLRLLTVLLDVLKKVADVSVTGAYMKYSCVRDVKSCCCANDRRGEE